MAKKCSPADRVTASSSALEFALEDSLGIDEIASKKSATPATKRLVATQEELARLALSDTDRGTILYLAYGSNLSIEKFRKARGIRPLSQINVQVPTLRLTFDVPGIPYSEPCFANSGRRDPDRDRPVTDPEKDLLHGRPRKTGYNKDSWHKGLVGVVYEVTPTDYAHIIATEGGGAGYKDILVKCYAFKTSDPNHAVPQDPSSTSFGAHTLFAPPLPDEDHSLGAGRFSRPDRSYAQPSLRYLKLLTDGAAELGLPYEYQDYLRRIRPFRITTHRQRLGQAVLTMLWMPVILLVFALGRIFSDKQGLLPGWLRTFSSEVFRLVWVSYDNFFRPAFGEGERSIPDGGGSVV